MNARVRGIGIAIILAALALLLWQAQEGRAQGPLPQAPGVALGTAFNYQGQLRKNGSPHNGVCNFQFSLWDAASSGAQQGNTQTANGITVTNGIFAAPLDFGAQFSGDARWLQTAVQCAGDGGFSTLLPRTALVAVPYALYAPNAGTADSATNAANAGYATSAGSALSAATAATATMALSLAHGTIMSGTGPVGLHVNSANGNAVVGYSRSSDGYGLVGLNSNGPAIYAESLTSYGIFVQSGGTVGVQVSATNGDAIVGISSSSNGYGVVGANSNGPAILAESTTSYGLYVNDAGAAGVHVSQADLDGVFASGGSGYSGVYGLNQYPASIGVKGVANGVGSVGIWGESSNNTGTYGLTTDGKGIWGLSTGSGYAGYFSGNVHVQGTLSKSAGSFKIDHPLDPANKYLSHSFVESPDMKNIYDGNVTTDAKGDATVVLPAYFEALNKDFRYQLTVIGTFAQASISEEISGNQFRIKTDKPNVKVSWQVTGIRKDPYAEAHRIVVEVDKPAKERGLYQFPELYGAPVEQGINYANSPVSR